MQNISATVSKAKHGNQDALSILYNENYRAVLFAIRSVIKDEDEAMDILQDTFVKAFNSLDQLKDPEKFTAWVKQIAVNNALQNAKKKKPILFSQMQSSESDSEWNVEDSFQEESREGVPDIEIDRGETERLIAEILDTLPEDQRIVINLFYFEQMSAKEIANEIGISVTLVNTRLALGKKKVEKKVLELEKKGTKLYGLAPIPFLLLLFKNVEVQAAAIQPDNTVLQSVLKSMANPFVVTHEVGNEEFPSAVEYFGKKASQTVKKVTVKFSAASTTTKAIIIGIAVVAGILAFVLPKDEKSQESTDNHAYPEYETEETASSVIQTEEEIDTYKLTMHAYGYLLELLLNAVETDDFKTFSDEIEIANGYYGIWFEEPYFAIYSFPDSEDNLPLLFVKGEAGDGINAYHAFSYNYGFDTYPEETILGFNSDDNLFSAWWGGECNKILKPIPGGFEEVYKLYRPQYDTAPKIVYPDGAEETLTEEKYYDISDKYRIGNCPFEWVELTKDNIEDLFGSYQLTEAEQQYVDEAYWRWKDPVGYMLMKEKETNE